MTQVPIAAMGQEKVDLEQRVDPGQKVDSEQDADLEQEIDRIQKTAEKQLASVHGLNVSLVKKIRMSDAHTKALLFEIRELEQKNADFLSQLQNIRDENHNLSIKAKQFDDANILCQQKTSEVVAAELAKKKAEAVLDSVTAERDSLKDDVEKLKVHVANLELDLEQAKQLAKKQEDDLRADIEERKLELGNLSQQTEEHRNIRDSLQLQVDDYEKKLAEAKFESDRLLEEKDLEVQAAKARVELAESRIAEASAEAEEAKREFDSFQSDRSLAQEEKDEHERTLVALRTEKDGLDEKSQALELEKLQVLDELEKTKVQLAALQSDLVNEARESKESKEKIEKLVEERDQLRMDLDALKLSMDETEKDAEVAKSELESRSLNFTAIQSEANLLRNEKSTLQKDFDDARERCTQLEREKFILEKQKHESEAAVKDLGLRVSALEVEKEGLITAHEKELHEKIYELKQEFERDTMLLRQELDEIVDRHAAERRVEMKREAEAAASAAAAAASLTSSGEGVYDDVLPTKTEVAPVEMLEQERSLFDSAVTVPDEPAPHVSDDGVVSDARDIVIGVVVPDVEDSTVGATTTLTERDLEVPTELPKDPVSFQGHVDDVIEDSNEAGVAVMTRSISDDSEDSDSSVISDSEPAEGETTTSAVVVISEEVVDEVVVAVPDGVNVKQADPEEIAAALPVSEEAFDTAPSTAEDIGVAAPNVTVAVVETPDGIKTERENVAPVESPVINIPPPTAQVVTTRKVDELRKEKAPATSTASSKGIKNYLCCGFNQ